MKTEWKKVRLGEICSKIGSGATPSGGSRVYIENGISFIRSQNVYNLNFDYEGLTHITDEAAKKLNGVTIEKDDVLLNITGDSVARTCIVPKNVLPARVNQHVSIIRPKEKTILPKFLNYYLASPYMQSVMLGLAVGKGASRNAITKTMIENFEVPYPPLETQKKIAGILSAYDDLIENNRKQIKLLEEAAQKLYKEWFVKLNFPGHENVKIVDGVPEGWKKEKLENWCRVFTGKKNANQNVENGIYPFFTCAPVPLLSNDSLYEGKAVIISGNGSYTGRTQYYDGNFDLYQRTYACVRQKQEDYEYMPFIYYSMKILFEPIKMGGTKGSAIPYIVMADITNTEFLYQYDICKKFSVFAESVLDKIQILQNQIRLIQFARDRLLPRFMNGELEV